MAVFRVGFPRCVGQLRGQRAGLPIRAVYRPLVGRRRADRKSALALSVASWLVSEVRSLAAIQSRLVPKW